MGSIVGVLRLDGRPAERREVSGMLALLAHRAPAGSGSWIEGSVALGQGGGPASEVRPGGPERGAGGSLVVAADARLDGRRELARRLGVPETGAPDALLILRAFEELGEACVEVLWGDFAFAVWDRRNRTLFCARDRLGVKPFYYHRGSAVLALASEMKALLGPGLAGRRLDEIRLADYLGLRMDELARTFYREVRRLPPGHHLTFRHGAAAVRRYWTPGPPAGLPPARELPEALRELLSRAVRSRTRGAGPPACLLSGGLDSAAVAWTAQEERPEVADPLPTYSAIFPEIPACDEQALIRATLAAGRFWPRFLRGDLLDPHADWQRIYRVQEEPLWAPALFLAWALYRAAGRDGIRIILDGFDGNTTVPPGSGRLAELLWSGRLLAIAKEVSALARRSRTPAGSLLWQRALTPGLPGWIRCAARAIRRPRSPEGLVHRDVAARVGLAARAAEWSRRRAAPVRSQRDDQIARLLRGLTMYGFEMLDKAGAACGVEPRFPFADPSLVEFSLALPSEEFLSRGWDRLILRRAMSGRIPDRVAWRRDKSDLSPVISRALLTFEAHRLDEILRHQPGRLAACVDLAAAQRCLARFRARPSDGDALSLWLVLSLGLWLRAVEPEV